MSAARKKGTAWETALVAFLREKGWTYADRVPMSGAKDRGDVTLGPGSPVIEAKNQNRMSWAEWLDEATAESLNADAPFGVVWAKRRGRTSPGHGYVLMDGATFAALLSEAGY